METERPCAVRPQERVLAVIPARDEEATVADVVADVRRVLGCEVLVIDDGSTDETTGRALEAGARVLRLPFPLGAWCAAQAGMRFAHAHGFATVVTLDADGQHHAESLLPLLRALRSGDHDVVIGACPQRLSVAKQWAWRYFRWLTRLPIQDFTSGLRAYGPRSLTTLASRQASLLDYQDIGVLLLLARRGLRVCEVAVTMSERRAGRSRVFSSWFTVARYLLQTTVLCLARVDARGAGPRRATTP